MEVVESFSEVTPSEDNAMLNKSDFTADQIKLSIYSIDRSKDFDPSMHASMSEMLFSK